MKRFLPLFTALLLLCSCTASSEPVSEIDISVLMQDIIDTQTFSDEMMIVSAPDSEYSYLVDEIIGTDYNKALFYFPMVGISSDMIMIVEINSKADLSSYANLLSDYLDERYEAYMGYAPEEAKKIKNGIVITHGNYIILMVLPDMDSAQETVANSF